MTSSRKLFIDIETSSTADLAKTGVYRYAESQDFEILLFAFSFDGDPVEIIDIKHFEAIPDFLIDAILDPDEIKIAHNAAFERICISRYFYDLGILDEYEYLDPSSWQCSMIHAATLGLPLSLDQLSQVLKLERPKLKEGRALIKMFCHGPVKNEDPEKWELFKAYNIRDVEAEIEIEQRLMKFPVSKSIWSEYRLDQLINDTGVLVDINMVENALLIGERAKESLTKRLQEMTGLDNPNSPSQMKEWLEQQGLVTDTLNQKAMKAILEKASPKVREALILRNQLAMASIKKYDAMLASACADGRIRGVFQFYGAIRTGRYSGRIVQLQNLPRNEMTDLKQARALVENSDAAALEMLYEDIPDTLSQLIRTALIAPPGKDFIVADFSAIEARVLSWLAEEEWRQKVFKENGDIYCATASRMFKVPVVKHGVNGELRQKGKQAELACGYGGSVGAMKAMGALDFGMKESELKPLVDSWREANPKIVKFWWAVDKAIKKVLKTRKPVKLKSLTFSIASGILFIQLPSGRSLAYPMPKLGENSYGSESVTYMGLGMNKKWERLESYGPKFVENITQAVSRDLLLNAMRNCSDYKIVAHVHDEIIIEADPELSVETVCQKMCVLPSWADGLVLNADGYRTPFYCKD